MSRVLPENFSTLLGVSPAKLLQMRKDDSALTPEELVAVGFARKLTVEPWSVEDSDYADLERAFGKQGALEVLMQSCNFSYMNHFTDGLRLPSEDVAVKTYLEVYGTEFNRR
jgi:alkylhydroperoxidase family enzyme